MCLLAESSRNITTTDRQKAHAAPLATTQPLTPFVLQNKNHDTRLPSTAVAVTPATAGHCAADNTRWG